MAGKDWFRRVVTFKQETTEGTDAVPVVGTNAFQVLNFTPTFMDADQKVRNLDLAYFGARPAALAAFKRGATFDMEIAGSGTATTPTGFMAMLQFAGFGAPVVGASSVTQSPISAGVPSATMYAWISDLQLIAIGGRMSVGFRIEDDEYPTLSFNYLGRPPVALAAQNTPGTPVPATYAAPVLASSENTSFVLDGFAVPLRRWTMDANVDLQYRSLIGPTDRVNYRDRAWRGEIVAEVPDLTVKDYFSKIRPGDYMPVGVSHGTVSGNIIQISCPQLQVQGNVTLSEDQGKVMMTMPVAAVPTSAGNDEIVFAQM